MSGIQGIVVDRGFITQRNERAKKYNPNGRTKKRLLMDIDCELYEYLMIKNGVWKDDNRWQIDGHAPGIGAVDVKCIKGFYNIGRKKLLHILKQRGIVDYYWFVEWVERPDRPLKTGDRCGFKNIGLVGYEELLDNIQVSFKADGYYLDARRLCSGEKRYKFD